jgi:8-oxo-dGTP pyrophosphatase MutT (NUDIX family)
MATRRGIAIPHLSVSVIPVRPGGDATLDVFVQHRARTMDFAADVVVFPGGRVSPEDHRPLVEEQLASSVLDRHAVAWSRTSIAGARDAGLRALRAA